MAIVWILLGRSVYRLEHIEDDLRNGAMCLRSAGRETDGFQRDAGVSMNLSC